MTTPRSVTCRPRHEPWHRIWSDAPRHRRPPTGLSVTAELEHSARLKRDPHRSRSRSSLSRLGGRRRRDPPRVRCRTSPRTPAVPASGSFGRRGDRSLAHRTPVRPPRWSTKRAPFTRGSTPLTTSTACSRCFVQCAFAAPAVPPASSVLRLGQPHAERAEGRRPHRRRAHEPGDRRAAVRLPPHGRDPRRARAAEARARQPGRAGRRGGPPQRHPGRRSQQLRQHPQETEPALEGDLATPRRLTQPAGGSSTSSRIVISTRRSCPHGSQPASVT